MLFSSIVLYAGFFLAPTALAADSVCNGGIYSLLQPLKSYAPAQAFCSSKYPPGPSRRFEQRAAATTAARKTTTTTTTKTTTTGKPSKVDKNAALYTSLSKAAASVAKTLCSCIQPQPTTTTTTSITPTPTPNYSCETAFNCDTFEPGSACGNTHASCSCFQSTSGRNYCTNGGSNGLRDCSIDADCGDGYFCATHGCAGNVCTVITTQCDNANGPYRLFARQPPVARHPSFTLPEDGVKR